MAWTTPHTFIVGEAPTAELLNQMLRDNMNEQAPANALNVGGYFVSAGANSVKERRMAVATVNKGFDLTTHGEWVAGDGPEVEVEHGGQLLAWFGARIYLASVSGECSVSASVVGQTGPSFNWAVRHSITVDDLSRSMGFRLFTGLTPGTDTVRLEYHTETVNAHVHQRQLLVMPM